MESEHFYCVASSQSDSNKIEASVTFPRPLDTSHEIAVVYCSFRPNSGTRTDIWVRAKSIKQTTSHDAAKEVSTPTSDDEEKEGSTAMEEESWIVNFDDVPANIPLSFVVPAISKKLVEEVGNNMSEGTPLKIYDAGKFMGWWLKIQKYTEIELSPSLAGILGQSTLINNNGRSLLQLPINPQENSYAGSDVTDNVYYLTCNQLQPNCITDFGGATRLLDAIPIGSPDRVVTHTPSGLIYQPLADDILHPKVNITLINRDGLPVFADSPQLYVLLHLRKIRNVAYGKRKLARFSENEVN
jgi:hypothetical protein